MTGGGGTHYVPFKVVNDRQTHMHFGERVSNAHTGIQYGLESGHGKKKNEVSKYEGEKRGGVHFVLPYRKFNPIPEAGQRLKWRHIPA